MDGASVSFLFFILFLLAGLSFTIFSDPYISPGHRKTLLLIVGLCASLVVQNCWEYALSVGPLRQLERRLVAIYGYSEYAVNAFDLHASGYLLKPVNKEKLAAEIAYALSGKRKAPQGRVIARTFGSFDLFVDGELTAFRQAKCKELLAYLIDRQGGSVTRAEAFAILWEDRLYDRGMQKQFDVIIRSLRDTLEEYGVGEILEMKKGALRIRPEVISCDAWRFFKGDTDAVNAFRGEYMSAYAWGAETESFMSRKLGF